LQPWITVAISVREFDPIGDRNMKKALKTPIRTNGTEVSMISVKKGIALPSAAITW